MGIDKTLSQFVDAVRDMILSMDEKLNILVLGLDYKRYAKFRRLTPEVVMLPDGTYRPLPRARKKSLTADDCEFCYDFVVETALRIQEMDSLTGLH